MSKPKYVQKEVLYIERIIVCFRVCTFSVYWKVDCGQVYAAARLHWTVDMLRYLRTS